MFARGETIVFLDTPSPRSKLIRNDEYETMSLFLVKIEKIPRSFFFPSRERVGSQCLSFPVCCHYYENLSTV